MIGPLKSIRVCNNFFILMGICSFFFIISYFVEELFIFSKAFTFLSIFITFIDFMIIFFSSKGIQAERITSEKLSNGDINNVEIRISNKSSIQLHVEIIDELPFQFQKRDFLIKSTLKPSTEKKISYEVRPIERGEYNFGKLNIFIHSPIGLAQRHMKFGKNKIVPVYPSIIQMQKFDLFAVTNRLSEVGAKKIRRIGDSMEFDQISDYIIGDDYRKINWKATARKNKLKINRYREERSQHVYSVIDMGRTMKMPFDNMTLLDYSINASLVLSNVAIRREDKAGIVTFANKIDSIIPADKKYSQIQTILEVLYNCKTDFLESNYEELYKIFTMKIKQRSLVLFFSNFETLSSLKRNLKFFIMLAKKHFLVVIFFENTELKKINKSTSSNIEKIYSKTIADKFAFEKKQIIKELTIHGINSIFSTPEKLTINTINKYLELKARGLI